MSAATAPTAQQETHQRNFTRHPMRAPVDLIALRRGIPDNLPGRCTDISEIGVGAIVAGEMTAGQQVAIELRLPGFGVPIHVRAQVRHQAQLRCGLEFVGLSAEQRQMIRYWIYRSASQSTEGLTIIRPASDAETITGDLVVEDRIEDPVVEVSSVEDLVEKEVTSETVNAAEPPVAGAPTPKPWRRIRIGRRGFYVVMAAVFTLAGLGWWQWQRSWNELEKRAPIAEGMRVPSETMEQRIVTKVEPAYPEAARTAGIEGGVVLDALIAADGSVKRLRKVSGPDLLVQSATQAVEGWKFEPYLSNGQPVEVQTTIAVEFRLH